MTNNFAWRDFYACREDALRQGEEIAADFGFSSPPVDVFKILENELELVYSVGENFESAFDGRIQYVGPRFLLCYNTKYDRWPHSGKHHSKVVFTIAHELGHFYLERHRRYLVRNLKPHNSFAEFSSEKLIEAEADHFACGLLMPSTLMRRLVNSSNFPTIGDIKDNRRKFEVSLTSFLARWTQLSDFPCATIATSGGEVLFGWTSQRWHELGCYRVRRGHRPEARYFQRFCSSNSPVEIYREGEGLGSIDYWLDWDRGSINTVEFYFAIPHSNQIWVLLFCDETELMDDRFD